MKWLHPQMLKPWLDTITTSTSSTSFHFLTSLLGTTIELPGCGDSQGQSLAGIIGEDLGSFSGLTQDIENMSVGREMAVQSPDGPGRSPLRINRAFKASYYHHTPRRCTLGCAGLP